MIKKDFRFGHLGDFATFILNEHIQEACTYYIQALRARHLPFVTLFAHEVQLSEFALNAVRDYLLKAGTCLTTAVLHEVEALKQLNYKIGTCEIGVICSIYRQLTLQFVEQYTQDVNAAINIARESEMFCESLFTETLEVEHAISVEEKLKLYRNEVSLADEKRRECFNLIAQATNDVLWDWDMEHDRIWWSVMIFDEMTGKEALAGAAGVQARYSCIHPDDKARVMKGVDKAIQTGVSQWTDEYRYLKSDGSYITILDRARILRNPEGKALRMIGSMQDVSALRRTEEALLYQSKLTQIITDNATAGLFMMNERGYCTFMNPAAEEMIGFTLAELKDKPLHDYIHHTHPDGRHFPMHECPIDKALPQNNDVRAHEDIFIRKDGSFFPVVCAARPIIENGVPVGTVIEVRDITEEKKAKNTVIESAERFRLLIEAIPQMAWTAQPDGMLDYFNQVWYDYTCLSFEESVGWGWTSIVHPDDLKRTLHVWSDIAARGIPTELELRLMRASDRQYRWHLTRCNALKNQQGEVVLWVGTNTDIHEQKMSQENLELAQQQLSVQNQELIKINTDLDNFIYTASHDLKTPVLNLEGLVSMLSRHLDEKLNDADHRLLEMVNLSVIKLKKTIKDLTEITRVQRDIEEEKESITFAEILEDVIADINGLMKESDVCIKTDFKETHIVYTAKNLRSIIYNLVSNAIKYRSPDRPAFVRIVTYREGASIVLAVKDNGLGIRKDQKHKLFTMFKRLHSHVEGTGIGLYIIKRIIENKGGKIEVESEADQGTTFKVFFPVTSELASV